MADGVTKNVSACAHGVTTISGVTSVDIEASRSVTAAHIDNDDLPSYQITGPYTRSVTVTSTDIDQLHDLEGGTTEASLVITLEGAAAYDNVTVTLAQALGHSLTYNASAPGEPASASLTFTGRSTNGTTDPLTIA